MNEVSIMIIDDDDVDRHMLKSALKKTKLNAKVFESVNGGEALDFLRDYEVKKKEFGSGFPPLIIFLDINMPKVDGFEFLEEFSSLREEIGAYQNCIIMMFSSSDSPEDRNKVSSYSFVKDFITKGESKPEEIKEKINKLITA